MRIYEARHVDLIKEHTQSTVSSIVKCMEHIREGKE